MGKRIIFGVIGLLCLVFACQSEDAGRENDRLLAKVHNKVLYLSEMDGMFPPNTPPEDSVLIIKAYVDRWVRESLLLHEAERNIPGDLNIDKLVRDYRASLIKDNYEKLLVQELLDSTITQAELTEFYERNKEQYQLETPIVRCYFIKVPVPVPEASKLRRLWNSNKPEDFAELVAYSNKFAVAHLLEEGTWYNVETVAADLPPGTLTADNVGSKRDFSQRDSDFQYYFRLFELKKRKDIAPLSYIEDQARKVILRKRKITLLEEAKKDMYEKELRRSNIEVYTD